MSVFNFYLKCIFFIIIYNIKVISSELKYFL